MTPRRSDGVIDLLVVGGGVMGLFTAYHASQRSARVVVLERGRVGDPMTASYGRTRSFRNDYLDPAYAALAHEAFGLWGEFEAQTSEPVLVRCGLLNIAKRAVTPDLAETYGQRSAETLTQLGMPPETLDREALRRRFPYLEADAGNLHGEAGVVDLPAVTRTLRRVLEERGAQIVEGAETAALVSSGGSIRAVTDAGEFIARALVVTAGHGTNDVLSTLRGCNLRVPISRDRPSEAKYVVPPAGAREEFTAPAMPVIAYLDAGIYCHPVVDGLVDAVKIGYYNPPDIERGTTSIDSIASFIAECMPGLGDAAVRDVVDVDQCDYDLVADDDFVLGAIPGFVNAFVGVGWRGTGYKFAPWVGRALAALALQDGAVPVLDRFDPARFEGGRTSHAPSVAEDPAAAPR